MSQSDPIVIRSQANPTVRHLSRMRDNRARRRAGRVLVDGWRETAHALMGGLPLVGLYVAEDSPTPEPEVLADRLLRSALEADAVRRKRQPVSTLILDKIAYGQSARGVVAEFEALPQRLDQLRLPEQPLVLVLDRIEKPGNLGAVFRCADAAGVDAVLLCDGGDLYNPNAIRGSLGAVFRVPSGTGSERETAEFLRRHGLRPIAARVEAAESLWQADLRGPIAIVLGSEAHGLADRWRWLGDQLIEGLRIPMGGEVDSLNLSVSAAVIAFEASRQRNRDAAG